MSAPRASRKSTHRLHCTCDTSGRGLGGEPYRLPLRSARCTTGWKWAWIAYRPRTVQRPKVKLKIRAGRDGKRVGSENAQMVGENSGRGSGGWLSLWGDMTTTGGGEQ